MIRFLQSFQFFGELRFFLKSIRNSIFKMQGTKDALLQRATRDKHPPANPYSTSNFIMIIFFDYCEFEVGSHSFEPGCHTKLCPSPFGS